MYFHIPFSSLDEMDTPIMICDGNGLVTYKNPSAMRLIRLPKRATHVTPHMMIPCDFSQFCKFISNRRPCVISIDTGDRFARAIVAPYGDGTYLWVFASFLQVMAYTGSFTKAQRDILEFSFEICDVVKCIDQSSKTHSAQGKKRIQDRISDRLNTIIDGLYGSDAESDGGMMEVYRLAELFSKSIQQTFSKVDIDVKYSHTVKPAEKNFISVVDFSSVYAMIAHVLHLCVRAFGDKHIDISLSQESEALSVSVKFTCAYPPFLTKDCKDPEKLLELSSRSAVDTAIIRSIIDSRGFDFSFSLKGDVIDNGEINIKIPTQTVPVAFAGTDREQYALYQKDFEAYLFNMFMDL